MARFTTANAREMAAKSHAVRREHLSAARVAANHSAHQPQSSLPNAGENPLVGRIGHAISLTLDKLEDPKTAAKDRQALSMSLRALRETYHMVTGESLPGRLKESPRQNWRSLRELPPPRLVPLPTPISPSKPFLPASLPPEKLEPLELEPFEPTPPPPQPQTVPNKQATQDPPRPLNPLEPAQINESPLIQHTPVSPRMTWGKDGKFGYHTDG